MYICYGITKGPYSPIMGEDQFLWRAPLGCEIAVESQDDLILTVPEFDSSKSTPVWITLKRKGSDMSVVELWGNSHLLNGKPELVWGSI